jgi:hypothetical protein
MRGILRTVALISAGAAAAPSAADETTQLPGPERTEEYVARDPDVAPLVPPNAYVSTDITPQPVLPGPPVGPSCPPTATIVPAPVVAQVAPPPVVYLRPMPATMYAGRGIVGQPKLYVPGQPLRNFVRYLTP